jgi:hypothetical protein
LDRLAAKMPISKNTESAPSCSKTQFLVHLNASQVMKPGKKPGEFWSLPWMLIKVGTRGEQNVCSNTTNGRNEGMFETFTK